MANSDTENSDEGQNNSTKYDALTEYYKKKITRRQALSTAAKAAIGVAIVAVGGVAAYEALNSGIGAASTSSTVSTSTTGGAGGANNLTFVHWHFEDAQVSSYLQTFTQETSLGITQEALDNNNFNPLLEAKFQSGEVIDMHYANGYEVPRLLSLGYDKDASTMNNISQIKSEMYPSIVDSLSTVDGNLIGLCYYWSARPTLTVNDAVLSKTSLSGQRPQSWKDLWTVSGPAVQKSGVVQYSIMPNWFSANYGIGWDFMGEMANAYNDPDDTNGLFAKNFQPVFDTNTDCADLLTMWQTATKNGLVDPAVFSQASESDTVAAGNTGKYAYITTAVYDFMSLNDPKASQIPAGQANLVDVSSQQSGWGMIENGIYCWPKVTHSDANSQQLIQYLGYKDPKTGKRVTQPQWAMVANLGSGYSDTLQDPNVIAAYQGWLGSRTTSTLKTQADIAAGDKTPWIWKSTIYTSWQDTIYPVLSSVASGVLPVAEGITKMRDLADTLWAQTYGSSSSTAAGSTTSTISTSS
jgi:hypothetical protein